MLSNLIKLEHVVEGKSFYFLCDNDSPFPYVKEALFQFGKYVGHLEDNINAQKEQIKAEAEVQPEEPKLENIAVTEEVV